MVEILDVEKIEIKHCGDVRIIKSMKEELEAGRASYWHWHTLLNKFISLYRKNRDEKDYGILLPEFPLIDKTPSWDIEGKISQGSYDKKTLFRLIDMYYFLLTEDEIPHY